LKLINEVWELDRFFVGSK